MSLTKEQLEIRKKGIGASESAIVMNAVSYSTPYELWMIKTGKMEAEDISGKLQVKMGILLEEFVAQYYEEVTGVKLKRVPETLFHKDHPYMLCHLDRVVEGTKKIVEIKCASPFNVWGKEGTDQVPHQYIIQVQHQLAITGYDEADLVVFRHINDFKIHPIKRDDELIKMIEHAIQNFWVEHVMKDIAPPLSNRYDVSLCYPNSNGQYKEADINCLTEIYKLKEVKLLKKALDQQEKIHEDEIIKSIAEHDGLKMEDAIVATWKPNKNGVRSLRIRD